MHGAQHMEHTNKRTCKGRGRIAGRGDTSNRLLHSLLRVGRNFEICLGADLVRHRLDRRLARRAGLGLVLLQTEQHHGHADGVVAHLRCPLALHTLETLGVAALEAQREHVVAAVAELAPEYCLLLGAIGGLLQHQADGLVAHLGGDGNLVVRIR